MFNYLDKHVIIVELQLPSMADFDACMHVYSPHTQVFTQIRWYGIHAFMRKAVGGN